MHSVLSGIISRTPCRACWSCAFAWRCESSERYDRPYYGLQESSSSS
jgi:hypothetical protein